MIALPRGTLAMEFVTLKRSREFRRVRGGVRHATPWFVIEGRARPADEGDAREPVAVPRFGFTITRKVGNAVVRNRIRRRLKEALRQLEAGLARADTDYVVVASRASHDYPFAALQEALRAALMRIGRQGAGGRKAQTKGPTAAAGAAGASQVSGKASGGPESGAGQAEDPRAGQLGAARAALPSEAPVASGQTRPGDRRRDENRQDGRRRARPGGANTKG